MYNRESVRSNVLGMLQQVSQDEVKFNKQQNFERATQIALSEVEDFEKLFHKFLSDVSHLEVFQHSIKEPLTRDMEKMTQNLKYLIQKNYTKEEREGMPENVLNQVRATQEKRYELFRKVARKYLSKPKQD